MIDRLTMRRSVFATLAATALLSTVACESSTAPASTLDTKAALADYRAMDSVFASDAWAAFRALGGRSPLSADNAVAAISTLPAFSPGAASAQSATMSTRAFALDVMRRLSTAGGDESALRETVISSAHRGKTFTYDAASDQYVVNTTRTGAPANGTRFALYEVGANGKPIVAQEIGYADLLDEGVTTDAAVALHLLTVVRGRTSLDYRLRVVPQGTGGTIDVSGFVLGEQGERLEFTIGVVGTTTAGTSTVSVEFDLGMAQREFEVWGNVRGADGSDDGTVELSARHGDHTLRVDMEGAAGTLDGTIDLDGTRFVTVTGSKANPTLRNALDQPLSGPELLLMLEIVDATDDVFDLVQDLLKPVDNLLVLGWIL